MTRQQNYFGRGENRTDNRVADYVSFNTVQNAWMWKHTFLNIYSIIGMNKLWKETQISLWRKSFCIHVIKSLRKIYKILVLQLPDHTGALKSCASHPGRLNRGVRFICFKANLMKCCSTLTGLSELNASCALPSTSVWMTLGVMHTGRLGMKRFLQYTCADRYKSRHLHRTCRYVAPRGLWDMLLGGRNLC